MRWFIVLCVLGFCCFATLSAQGFDPLFLSIWAVLLWIFGPSLIFVVWFAARYQEKRKTRLKPANLLAYAMCCSLSFSVAFFNWPLRLNFLLSRPALVHEVQNLTANKTSTSPRWVGGFYVRETVIDSGSLCLWTDNDPSGRTGLVYMPAGSQPALNLWSDVPLGKNWHAISED